MTRRNYYFSDTVEADSQIISCEKIEGHWSVQLDGTLFHPQGGGQLADVEWINDCQVLAVEACGEAIHHLVEHPLAIGHASLRVDSEIRSLHTLLHSAGHLIGHAGIAQGLTPIKAQHWPNASRVVFQSESSQSPDLSAMAWTIEAMIEQDLARNCEMQNGLRVVGFGQLPVFPCGGTHVRSLADIGAVRLLEMKRKKDQLTISYTIS